MIRYEINSQERYADKIGDLVFMMEHVRAVTIEEVKGIGKVDLDHLEHKHDNSIGALLLHIAAIEKVHQLISFEGRDFNEEEHLHWGSAIELGEKARQDIKNNSIEYYIDKLNQVRNKTFQEFEQKDDTWLYEQKEWPNGIPYNNYYLWFHVLEDEINHRGQIRAIKRRLL